MFLAGVYSCREAVSVFPLSSAKLHRAAISCVALSQTVSDVHWLFLCPLRKNPCLYHLPVFHFGFP